MLQYTFATISYSAKHDTWYVDLADPYADIGSCEDMHPKCYGQVGDRALHRKSNLQPPAAAARCLTACPLTKKG